MADNIPLNPHFLKRTLKLLFRKWGQGVLFLGVLKYGVTVVFLKEDHADIDEKTGRKHNDWG